MKKIALLALATLLISGCATISSSPEQLVNIKTEDGSRLTAYVQGKRVVLPTSISVKRNQGAVVEIHAADNEGYNNSSLVIPKASDINPWYFGNVIFGGAYGITTTDPLTGAMWQYNNPNFIVPVNKKSSK